MERLDDTGFGTLKIFQNVEDFCYGVDAVLLANFAAVIMNEKKLSSVVDLGTGTGIVPLILSHKTKATIIRGVEIQKKSFETGKKNIDINNLSERLIFCNSNVKDVHCEGGIFYNKTFDAVTTNPPYTESGGGITGQNQAKAIARHEVHGTLADFVECASKLLKDKGDFFMVHRPSRLVDICCVCRQYSLEPKEIQLVSGRPMDVPNILLIHCVKNGNRQLKMLKPFAVYGADNGYSEEIINIYERGNLA